MAQCANPGCYGNDETNDQTMMFLEYLPDEETWVSVCPRHANHDNVTIEQTEEVKETSIEVLTQVVEQVE